MKAGQLERFAPVDSRSQPKILIVSQKLRVELYPPAYDTTFGWTTLTVAPEELRPRTPFSPAFNSFSLNLALFCYIALLSCRSFVLGRITRSSYNNGITGFHLISPLVFTV